MPPPKSVHAQDLSLDLPIESGASVIHLRPVQDVIYTEPKKIEAKLGILKRIIVWLNEGEKSDFFDQLLIERTIVNEVIAGGNPERARVRALLSSPKYAHLCPRKRHLHKQ